MEGGERATFITPTYRNEISGTAPVYASLLRSFYHGLKGRSGRAGVVGGMINFFLLSDSGRGLRTARLGLGFSGN